MTRLLRLDNGVVWTTAIAAPKGRAALKSVVRHLRKQLRDAGQWPDTFTTYLAIAGKPWHRV